jgi:hypothetical protein
MALPVASGNTMIARIKIYETRIIRMPFPSNAPYHRPEQPLRQVAFCQPQSVGLAASATAKPAVELGGGMPGVFLELNEK